MREIRFYFDYVSPYSYLAWRALRKRAIPVLPIPIVFGALLDAGGQRGPAEIPAKRRFLVSDCIRRADELGVPFTFPPRHPFRSLDALRASIGGSHERIDRLFAACWERGRDLSDRAVLEEVLEGPVPEDPETKAALKKLTDDAVARGVFGVPTFEVAGEIIWGSDRLSDALALAEGRTVIDPKRTAEVGDRPVGVVRKAIGPPPVDVATLERVEAIFARAAFMRALGVRVESIEQGRVVTSMSVRPDHLQQDDFVHAGVITTLADHTAGAAAGTTMDAVHSPLTIELKINLLRPAKGPELRCRSSVLRAGRHITVAESEVFDGAKMVAKAIVTLLPAAI